MGLVYWLLYGGFDSSSFFFPPLLPFRRGLITRNMRSAVDLFHQRFGIIFSPALSREFRPYKPDPAPLLHICSSWEVQPSEVMMVGDSLKDDVICGKRAGSFTCLLDQTGRYDASELDSADLKPDFKVSSLTEVFPLLEANFDLAPWFYSQKPLPNKNERGYSSTWFDYYKFASYSPVELWCLRWRRESIGDAFEEHTSWGFKDVKWGKNDMKLFLHGLVLYISFAGLMNHD